MAASGKERSLEVTPTWAVSVVCFVLVAISIAIEQLIHHLGEWLKKKHKRALYEALDKIKTELMLLGFISFLLTVGQDPITKICIPESVANSWHPCAEDEKGSDEYDDPCKEKDQVQFVSAYGIHQLHIFIFVLAVSHILYAITTLGLGRLKMRKWKAWEVETKTLEYQYDNDPERFRFARETSFGRRHMNSWSKSPIFLWIVCFLRQFLTSVAKVDYLTLRNGFITAHLAPTSLISFDFQKYISRSLDEDFKMVVGISPVIWLLAVLCLMSYTHGWYSYYWLPFYPLIVLLLVGTKLQMIITKMGLRIQDRGDIVKGTPMVQPGDDLFWFKSPRLMLFLIQFVLFQNAFQLAFFAWSWYEFGIRSCFHDRIDDILIRISMGMLTQVLCSYVTLPLYALVTQMGSKMKPVIFSDNVASALKSWHQTAKKHIKQGQVSGTTTPFWSRPPSPLHGMSPLHLLQGYQGSIAESLQASPRMSNFDNEGGSGSAEGSQSSAHINNNDNNRSAQRIQHSEGRKIMDNNPSSSSMPRSSRSLHEIEISLSDFSFVDKKFRSTDTL